MGTGANAIVVEPSPLLSHRGAWLLKGLLESTVPQSDPLLNLGFAFRLAMVKKLKGLPAIKKDSYPALLQVGT